MRVVAPVPIRSTDSGASTWSGMALGGGACFIHKGNLIINDYCFALISTATNNITCLFLINVHLTAKHWASWDADKG